jgi:hypothetical protein
LMAGSTKAERESLPVAVWKVMLGEPQNDVMALTGRRAKRAGGERSGRRARRAHKKS